MHNIASIKLTSLLKSYHTHLYGIAIIYQAHKVDQ